MTAEHLLYKLRPCACSKVLNLTLMCFQCVFCSQACVTYANFMTDLAKLIRTDRGLEVNDTIIREEVSRVMTMEKEIANVSMKLLIFKPISNLVAFFIKPKVTNN